jgi:hypothetical protein
VVVICISFFLFCTVRCPEMSAMIDEWTNVMVRDLDAFDLVFRPGCVTS